MAATVFQPSLYQPIQWGQFPNLHDQGRDHCYFLKKGIGQFGPDWEGISIEEKVTKNLLEGTENLKKISTFIRPILADKGRTATAVGNPKVEDRVYLHLNLEKISSYIDVHNKRVNDSLLIGFVHVLLLIVSLGIFHYRDTLRIDNFSSSLEKLGVTKAQQQIEQNSPLYQLRLPDVLSMKPADRDLLLDKMGLLAKWNGFFTRHPEKDNLDKLSAFNKAVFASYHLEDLRDAADLEKTVLVCFQEDLPVTLREIVSPHLKKITAKEREQITRAIPEKLRQDLLRIDADLRGQTGQLGSSQERGELQEVLQMLQLGSQ